MRSNDADYDIAAPTTLTDALALMAAEERIPIAGGTEIMVALGAGRLLPRKFVSLHQLHELRYVDTSDAATIRIGAGTTFTDIRRNAVLAEELPLLPQAASWTGSIANQNRGTLGGNIANASPAADTPPALLAYDAVLELVSLHGTRLLPYREFHLGYKKTALAAGELIAAIQVPRRFAGHHQWARKVGTRNAQAISKVALACTATVSDGIIEEVAIGAASLQDRPCRLHRTEAALRGQPPTDRRTILAAKEALHLEVSPIDDIRSTAQYRTAVAANLVEEYLAILARLP